MNASRARLYQTTLEQFYTRNPWGSVDQPVNPLSVPPPRHNGARGGLFALGAGQASAPIDVDEWTERRSASGVVGRASAPIDVDEWFAASLQTVNEGSGGSIGPPGAICAAASPNVRNIEEIREFFVCAICQDTYMRPVVFVFQHYPDSDQAVNDLPISTLCMHVFCDACISRSLVYSTSCPLCRCPVVDAPMRDRLFESELKAAIEDGIVKKSGAVGRRTPYTWNMSLS
ncbi:hypothetical protein B0H12DRAFT_1234398 [Mycena haematopus]|nr:hypothetical protein B0H12DRAFT_1234398 [Mycena haematopus]